jgi:hypothetical protein
MNMEKPHAHMGESIESISAFCLLRLRLLLLLVLPRACSPILASFCHLAPPLNLRHLLQIFVLSLQRLALSEQSARVAIK